MVDEVVQGGGAEVVVVVLKVEPKRELLPHRGHNFAGSGKTNRESKNRKKNLTKRTYSNRKWNNRRPSQLTRPRRKHYEI